MEFIHQPAPSHRLGDYVKANLSGSWTHFRAAVAFVKRSGTRHIAEAISAFARTSHVEIVAGIDHRGTSAEGLRDLLDAARPNGRVIVFHNRLPYTFHPKVYLFKSPGAAELLQPEPLIDTVRRKGTVKSSRICPFCGRILLDQRLRINDLAVAAGGENAAKLLNLTVPSRRNNCARRAPLEVNGCILSIAGRPKRKFRINGVYHHVGKQHLHRYLAEFDFRYNARDVSDGERANQAIRRSERKRLTYTDSRR